MPSAPAIAQRSRATDIYSGRDAQGVVDMLRLFGVGLAVLLASQAWADGCHLTSYGTLPVSMIGERATTTVSIDGRDTRFILDTGGSFNLMSRARASALGLRVSPAPFGLRISGIGGTSNVEQARVRKFGILGATLENIDFIVGGTDTGDGLLGANLLDAGDLEIDLAHGKMTLFKTDHCDRTALAYWTKDGRYEVAETRPSRQAYDRRTFVDVTVNGTKVLAVLDSGAPATLITRKAAERAGIDMHGSGVTASGKGMGSGARALDTWVARIDAFSVGSETIRHSKMQVIDGKLGDDRTDMLLGVDFLLAHHVYVANGQKKIYFTYNGGRVFTYADAPGSDGTTAAGSEPALGSAGDYALRGRAHLSRGESKAAVADLDEAIRRAPDHADYYLARARAKAGEHPEAALADLDKSLELDPKNADAWLMRAQLRFRQKDRAGAASDAAAASALVPAGSEQARSIAGLYVALDQPAAALPLLDPWIRLHRDDATLGAVLNERCWARGLSNRMLEGALKDCRKAIKRDGKEPAYLDSLGLVQLRLGHYAEAIDAYRQAIAQRPDSAWTRYGLGLAKIRAGQAEAGEVDLAAARRLDPQIETRAARYGLTAGAP
ncbi:MAG TPA: aspartyl protease family protein [Frateuria sp.]|uniref:aspartyl protease family protein n=1 Tax=Frateuria sp. TaxID=2211372 RepID=UPI002D7FB440|nr:aspartyl protease family protein [Frateuria sp.]HET6805286.1 aspartyl protease family protein [Frateuria sp.]